MRFIDLFAGLGGFHIALSQLSHDCVFACEKNQQLQDLYRENFKIECFGDIKKINEEDIPSHDILCAGFPCQPFSKAGKQLGLDDLERGDLINDIIRILKFHKPKYFILENVPNLKKHDREKTWAFVEASLRSLGYDVKESILSPHQFGVPQIRNRIFIVGSLGENALKQFNFPLPYNDVTTDIRIILDNNPPEAKKLNDKQIDCLNLWQKIIQKIPTDKKLPSFPIWGMEIGADYPINGIAPYRLSENELGNFRGAFGKPLKGLSKEIQLSLLPSYAQYDEDRFPAWKVKFLTDIRSFINNCDDEIKQLLFQLEKYPSSWQKLEWNCSNGERNIFKYLLQFRASGIRVKKTDYSPALVLNSTQIPIVGWEKRYLTLKEASRLQQLQDIQKPVILNQAYQALGNAVNVKTVKVIAEVLLKETGSDYIHKLAV